MATTYSPVLPKKTSSPSWLKGKEKKKKKYSYLQPYFSRMTHLPAQRDLFPHNTICVTLHWPEILTWEDNTQHQAPLLQPPQFNNFKARMKYSLKMTWAKKASVSKKNMIFLYTFALSHKNHLRCIIFIILTIISQWMSIYKFINFFETNHWHPNLLIPMKDSLSRYNCSCPTLPVTVSYTS